MSDLAERVLTCTDCMGPTVILFRVTWEEKILLDHAELTDNLYIVERTLTKPDSVHKDRLYVDRETYYKRGVFPAPLNQWLCKVVVTFDGVGAPEYEGKVISAFSVDAITGGERKKWPRK